MPSCLSMFVVFMAVCGEHEMFAGNSPQVGTCGHKANTPSEQAAKTISEHGRARVVWFIRRVVACKGGCYSDLQTAKHGNVLGNLPSESPLK